MFFKKSYLPELWLTLLLSSCTTLNKKDLDSQSKDQLNIQVKATTANEQKILEKFQVAPVSPVSHVDHEMKNEWPEKRKEKKNLSNKKVKTSVAPKKVTKSFSQKKKQSAPIEKTSSNVSSPAKGIEAQQIFPDDYPKEFIELDKRSEKLWNQYSSHHKAGQKFYLNINYLGMTVGKIMIVNHGKKIVNNKEVWHFYARFKSAPFYSSIYELDDKVDTYVTTDQFLSSRYSLLQRETRQSVDDLQLYDRDDLKTYWFYYQKKSDGRIKEKKIEKFIPYYSIDPFSVLFFYQGLPLRVGDKYEIPLINKGKLLLLKSIVEEKEVISTELGRKKAIRIHATTRYSGETLKSGELYFWFSDDDERVFLKAQAKIKIGSVTADIVDD